MIQRPEFNLASSDERHFEIHYGIFVALAGAAIIVAAGLRLRPKERQHPAPD
jgi:hypothetical protein